jgi:hypothetical protein
MPNFNPATSILAGRDTTQLQADLARLQQAWVDLQAGGKAEVLSYDQGGGAKSVTYTRANQSSLWMAIRLIQAQLGIIDTPRRALDVTF